MTESSSFFIKLIAHPYTPSLTFTRSHTRSGKQDTWRGSHVNIPTMPPCPPGRHPLVPLIHRQHTVLSDRPFRTIVSSLTYVLLHSAEYRGFPLPSADHRDPPSRPAARRDPRDDPAKATTPCPLAQTPHPGTCFLPKRSDGAPGAPRHPADPPWAARGQNSELANPHRARSAEGTRRPSAGTHGPAALPGEGRCAFLCPERTQRHRRLRSSRLLSLGPCSPALRAQTLPR